MTRIIKSYDTSLSSFAEYERTALEVLTPISLEAADPAAVLAQARIEAEQKVQEAYTLGLERGFEKGREEFRKSVAECEKALKNAATAIKEAYDEFLTALEPDMVRLAQAIAERILHREVRTDPELVSRTVCAALEMLAARNHVSVRVHPHDLEALRSHKVALLEQFDGLVQLDVLADESVEPGGCVAENSNERVDARLDAQLTQILDELMD